MGYQLLPFSQPLSSNECAFNWIFIHLTLLLLTAQIPSTLSVCPKICQCKWKNGKETIECQNSGLTMVPEVLDSGTQVLDLSGNNLNFLYSNVFNKSGLFNLQKLYLANCRLTDLDQDAFNRLTNLVELDLSYNSLHSVPSHSFQAISGLRELKLTGNPVHRLGNNAFSSLIHLTRLDLTFCQINTIDTSAFSSLTRLEFLYLDNNVLKVISSHSVNNLVNLKGIRLHNNSWDCSCQIRPFRIWLLEHNIPYILPPICKTPRRNKGRTWDELSLDSFACEPSISALKYEVAGMKGYNVTLTCVAEGIPSPQVKWIWKDTEIVNGTVMINGEQTYLKTEGEGERKLCNLTLIHVLEEAEGTYFCIAHNKAGNSRSNVTLKVSKKVLYQSSIRPEVITFILIACSVFTVLCIVVTCVLSIRRRRKLQTYDESPVDKMELKHSKPHSENPSAKSLLNNSCEIPVIANHIDRQSIPASYQNRIIPQPNPPEVVDSHLKQEQVRTWLLSGNKNDKDLMSPGNIEIARNSPAYDKSIDVRRNSMIRSQAACLKDEISPNAQDLKMVSPGYESHHSFSTQPQSPSVAFDIDPHSNSYKTYQNIYKLNDISDVTNTYSQQYATLPKKLQRKSTRFAFSRQASDAVSISEERHLLQDSPQRNLSMEINRSGDSDCLVKMVSKDHIGPKNSSSLLNLHDADYNYHTVTPLRKSYKSSLPCSPTNESSESTYNRLTRGAESYSSSSEDHSRQLQTFLEEYQMLQQQLWRVKESYARTRERHGIAVANRMDHDKANSILGMDRTSKISSFENEESEMLPGQRYCYQDNSIFR